MYIRRRFLLGSCALMWACGPKPANEAPVNRRSPEGTEEAPRVEYTVLQRADFAEEILSGGNLQAATKADVKWKTGEEIAEIRVKNGDYVQQGQVLARLNSTQSQLTLRQSRDALAKAELELQDMLIGRGYKLEDSLRVPEQVMEIAQLRSGYRQVKTSHEVALQNHDKLVLRAPIAGRVANLVAKPLQTVTAGERFCTLIDTRRMEVDFPLMEDEIAYVKTGTPLVLTKETRDTTQMEARVESVNPTVQEDGMVVVRAVGQGFPTDWLDGMKVSVRVQQPLPDMLAVPKSAVVTRDGKSVVFSIRNGLAYWNYVETGRENSTHYTIIKGLEAGDTIITTGNEQLAHLSPIRYK